MASFFWNPFACRVDADFYREDAAMISTLHNWIIVCSNAYVEYTFVSWLGKNVYRRTVDYRDVCLQ
jgi:hypothetical protein